MKTKVNNIYLNFPKFLLILVMMFFLIPSNIYSQSFNWDTEATRKGIKGITNVAASIISDSLTPMTHYADEEWTVTLSPSYFNIRRLFENPDIRGDDLQGWSVSLGGGYALSERFMAYSAISYMGINGTIKGNFYGESYGDIESDTSLGIFSMIAGFGFDLIGDNSRWSIPVYLGLTFMNYKISMDLPVLQNVPAAGNRVEIGVEDSSLLYGFSAGIAVSCRLFDSFKITPYYFYMRSFNKPELESSVSVTTITTLEYSQSLSVDRINASMIGLTVTGESSSNISWSLSVGGLLTSSTGYYNEEFLDGLNMISIVLAVTYRSDRIEPSDE